MGESVTFTGGAMTGVTGITGTSSYTVSSSSGTVTVESVTFNSGAMSGITEIDGTLANGIAGTSSYTVSSSGTVTVESVTFNGNQISDVSKITLTTSSNNDGIVLPGWLRLTGNSNDNGIRASRNLLELPQSGTSTNTCGPGTRSNQVITGFHGRIKLPTRNAYNQNCRWNSNTAYKFNLEWEHDSDSTLIASQCGANDNNFGNQMLMTMRITGTTSVNLIVNVQDSSGSDAANNMYVCWFVIEDV